VRATIRSLSGQSPAVEVCSLSMPRNSIPDAVADTRAYEAGPRKAVF
jgi:hypothetical protein